MINLEIFKIKEEHRNLLKEDVTCFQDWVDILSEDSFKKLLSICKKENVTQSENDFCLHIALSIFFRENQIDSIPLVEDLIVKMLGEFKNSIIKVGLYKSGRIYIDGPIRLEREMIPNGGVNVFSL